MLGCSAMDNWVNIMYKSVDEMYTESDKEVSEVDDGMGVETHMNAVFGN